MHVFDPAYPVEHTMPIVATIDQYRKMQERMGTTRTVVVQPRPYGTDNTATLHAIAALGRENARGVAVVHPDVPEAELKQLHDGGVRGVRFSLYTPTNAAVSFDMLEAVAQRIHPYGWHLQLHWTADQIVEHRARLQRLATPLVFDHMARLPPEVGTAHSAFGVVRELLAQRRAWIKLAGAYLCSSLGESQGYRDALPLARAWVEEAPDRLVWGSDWPHATEAAHPPDTVGLLDLLATWTGSDAIRKQVLVDNPAVLYQFN